MKKWKEIFNNFKSNVEWRSFLSASLSFAINIAFLVYNVVFGILYRTVWNWCIGIYYALLVVFRAIILRKERKWKKEETVDVQVKRWELFKTIGWCMIIMDVSLVAPITLMVLSKRVVRIGIIPTLAMASYTTYKITLAIINYTKKINNEHFSIKALRLITLKDAIVSVLTLQNTMVAVFGSGDSMLTLTAISSAALLLVLIGITTFAIVRARKSFIQ